MTRAEQSFWWSQDPLERFWLETTDRDDIGANLKAPQVDRAGKPNWRYTLLREVTPGDTVYHWDKGAKAIVGYSTVAGVAKSKSMVWAARGIHARKSRTKPKKAKGLLVPLGNFTHLQPPITLADIRAKSGAIKSLMNNLQNVHQGPLYFPFELSAKRPPRAIQGYLFKLPASFVSLMSGGAAVVPTSSGGGMTRASRGQGFGSSAAQNAAVEMWAMKRAQEYFESGGYAVDDTHKTESYDLLVRKGGVKKFAEVKGSTGDCKAVFLTRNEVDHYRKHDRNSVLVTVAGIKLVETAAGLEASGGEVRIHDPWSPDEKDLSVERYSYDVPMPPTAIWP